MSKEETISEVGATTPRVFSLLLLGYTLVVLGIATLLGRGSGAVLFAFAASSLGEIAAGIWELSRGETYAGNLIVIFGFWGFGRFLFGTVGEALGLLSPVALAIYYGAFCLPVAILYVPVFGREMGWVYHAIFTTVLLLLASNAVSYLLASRVFDLLAGTSALACAGAVWLLGARTLFEHS